MKSLILLSLAVLLTAGAAFAGDHDHHVQPVDDARFEFLKSLEGTWVGRTEETPGDVVVDFRVTAGGHAIEEREFVGTPKEMLTIYSMQGKDLVATHYCVLGNQPRVIAEKKVVNDSLTFACNGTPGNARSHDDEHIHGWSMRLDGDGKLHYAAEMVKAGEVTMKPSFVLTRQRQTASR